MALDRDLLLNYRHTPLPSEEVEEKPKGSAFDPIASFGAGAGDLVKGVGTFIAGSDSTVAELGAEAQEFWQAKKSAKLRADEAKLGADIQAGNWSGAGGDLLTNPVLMANMVAGSAPAMAVGMGAGGLLARAMTGAGVMTGATGQLTRAGGAVAAGAGEGAVIATDIYQETGGNVAAAGIGAIALGVGTNLLTPGNIGSTYARTVANTAGEAISDSASILSRAGAGYAVGRAAKGAGSEFTQEFVQEGGQALTEQWGRGEELNLASAAAAGTVGGILGGVIGGGLHPIAGEGSKVAELNSAAAALARITSIPANPDPAVEAARQREIAVGRATVDLLGAELAVVEQRGGATEAQTALVDARAARVDALRNPDDKVANAAANMLELRATQAANPQTAQDPAQIQAMALARAQLDAARNPDNQEIVDRADTLEAAWRVGNLTPEENARATEVSVAAAAAQIAAAPDLDSALSAFQRMEHASSVGHTGTATIERAAAGVAQGIQEVAITYDEQQAEADLAREAAAAAVAPATTPAPANDAYQAARAAALQAGSSESLIQGIESGNDANLTGLIANPNTYPPIRAFAEQVRERRAQAQPVQLLQHAGAIRDAIATEPPHAANTALRRILTRDPNTQSVATIAADAATVLDMPRPAAVSREQWDAFRNDVRHQTGVLVPFTRAPGGTVREHLEGIAGSGSRPGRVLAQTLLSTGNPYLDLPLGEFNAQNLRQHGSARGLVTSGIGDPRQVESIRMNQTPGKATESAFIHEALHALTMSWLKSVPTTDSLYRELKTLRNIAKTNAESQGKTFYGTHPGNVSERSQLAEFLAEAFARAEFQNFLDTISMGEGSRSAWAEFVEWVGHVIGISERSGVSALDRALRINGEVLERSSQAASDYVNGQGQPITQPATPATPAPEAEPAITREEAERMGVGPAPAQNLGAAVAAARVAYIDWHGNDAGSSRERAADNADRIANDFAGQRRIANSPEDYSPVAVEYALALIASRAEQQARTGTAVEVAYERYLQARMQRANETEETAQDRVAMLTGNESLQDQLAEAEDDGGMLFDVAQAYARALVAARANANEPAEPAQSPLDIAREGYIRYRMEQVGNPRDRAERLADAYTEEDARRTVADPMAYDASVVAFARALLDESERVNGPTSTPDRLGAADLEAARQAALDAGYSVASLAGLDGMTPHRLRQEHDNLGRHPAYARYAAALAARDGFPLTDEQIAARTEYDAAVAELSVQSGYDQDRVRRSADDLREDNLIATNPAVPHQNRLGRAVNAMRGWAIRQHPDAVQPTAPAVAPTTTAAAPRGRRRNAAADAARIATARETYITSLMNNHRQSREAAERNAAELENSQQLRAERINSRSSYPLAAAYAEALGVAAASPQSQAGLRKVWSDFSTRARSALNEGTLDKLSDFFTSVMSGVGQRVLDVDTASLRGIAPSVSAIDAVQLENLRRRYNTALNAKAREWAAANGQTLPATLIDPVKSITRAAGQISAEVYGIGRDTGGNPYLAKATLDPTVRTRVGTMSLSLSDRHMTTTGVEHAPGSSDLAYRIGAEIGVMGGQPIPASGTLLTNNNIRRQVQSIYSDTLFGPVGVIPLTPSGSQSPQGVPADIWNAATPKQKMGLNLLRLVQQVTSTRGGSNSYANFTENLQFDSQNRMVAVTKPRFPNTGWPKGTIVTNQMLKDALKRRAVSSDPDSTAIGRTSLGGVGLDTAKLAIMLNTALAKIEGKPEGVVPASLATRAKQIGRDMGGWVFSEGESAPDTTPITQAEAIERVRETIGDAAGQALLDSGVVTFVATPEALAELSGDRAEASPALTIESVPPARLKRTKVSIDAIVGGQEARIDVPAAEALANIDEEISAYELVLKCVKGG